MAGTPRWLIRGNFRDLLPTDLLDQWMRYGVQNSDYYLRIPTGLAETAPGSEEGTGSLSLQLLFRRYCTSLSGTLPYGLPDEAQDDFMYLCFVYILQKYLKIYHFC